MSYYLSKIWRGFLLAVAILTPPSVGLAAPGPINNIPINIEAASFYDGATLTGSFSLNVYGQVNSGWTLQLGAGESLNNTAIPAITFGTAQGELLGATGAPNTIEVTTNGAGNTPPLFYLTFQHALNIPGPDPFVIDANSFVTTPDSGECVGFSCTIADERLVSAGFAEVPEPMSMTILGFGVAALGTRRFLGRRVTR